MSDTRKILLLGVDGLIPELVERFCAEGVLPNIQRLREEGGSTRLLPYISTWGDTNFVTFLTGQAPGTSWVGQRMPPSGTRHLLELIAEADHKSALVHFPESLQPAADTDLCLAPFWSGAGPAPMELAPACLHTTDLSQWSEQRPSETLGWPPTGTLAHHHKHNRFAIERCGDGYRASIPVNRGEPVSLTLTAADTVLTLTLAQAQTTLSVGRWSEWLPLEAANEQGLVRFKLLAFDAARQQVELLQSQVTVPARLGNQPALIRRLIERHGPFISKWAVSADPDTRHFETSFEEGRYQLEWLTEVALTLLNEEDYRLFATVFRLNDETHHTCLAYCDPASPFFSKQQQGRYLDVIRRAYRLLDNAVGELLSRRRDDTIVVLASDHGDVPNRWLCDIHRRLAEFDLCTLDARGLPIRARSQAFLKNERGGLEIFVNRRDVFADGNVAVEDYETVQTRILRALTSWYIDTPGGERNVVALALKRQDASVLGYWGEHMGDVIFAYSPGFVWGTNTRGDTLAPLETAGANHGPQVPTASTGFASNHGLAIFHGKGIRAGTGLSFDTTGSVQRMDNAGATFARLLNLPDTASLDGRVMHALLSPQSSMPARHDE